MKAGFGLLSRKTTVSGVGASIAATSWKWSRRAERPPCGGVLMRSKLALTSAEVSALPSWKRIGWFKRNV